eukprot:3388451-Rhodomonas_salina.1
MGRGQVQAEQGHSLSQGSESQPTLTFVNMKGSSGAKGRTRRLKLKDGAKAQFGELGLLFKRELRSSKLPMPAIACLQVADSGVLGCASHLVDNGLQIGCACQ